VIPDRATNVRNPWADACRKIGFSVGVGLMTVPYLESQWSGIFQTIRSGGVPLGQLLTFTGRTIVVLPFTAFIACLVFVPIFGRIASALEAFLRPIVGPSDPFEEHNGGDER
jgi:hypothetical protein